MPRWPALTPGCSGRPQSALRSTAWPTGRDFVIEASLHAYDVQALMPIVEAAGGTITTWDGGRCEEGGSVVACGDRALHPRVLELLALPSG
jgi:hypothetical protein